MPTSDAASPPPKTEVRDRKARGSGPMRRLGGLHQTLAGKVSIHLCVFMTIYLVAALVVNAYVDRSYFTDRAVAEAEARLPGLARSFAILLEDGATDAVQDEARAVVENWGDGVLGLQVLDAEGNRLVRAHAADAPDEVKPLPFDLLVANLDGRPAIADSDGTAIYGFAPIVAAGDRTVIGYVGVAYALDPIEAPLFFLLQKGILLILISIPVVYCLVTFTMFTRVSRPLRQAVRAMTEVAGDRIDVALPQTDIREIKQMNRAMTQFMESSAEKVAIAKRSARAEAEAARLQREQAEAEAQERERRIEEERVEREAAEAARQRELALLRDLEDVITGAAAGDFARRMQARDGAADIGAEVSVPRLVNTLLERVQGGVADVSRVLSRLAEGDVSARMQGTFEGEFAALQTAVNTAARQLDDTLAEVSRRANDVMGDSSDLTAAATDLSGRTERTAATVAETTRALEEMVSSITATAALATEASGSAAEAEREARESDAVVRDAIQGMEEIKDLSGKIGKTLDIIDDIAFQTNLLALNAGVEAARAGPAGRGFAIVASEVRALARKVAEAAQQIGTLVHTSSERIEDGVGRVGRTGDTLETLGRQVRRIGAQVQEISDAAQAQSSGAAEMSLSMSQIDQATQENAAMFEETTAANQSLKAAASSMLGLMRNFRTTETREDADWDGADSRTA
ncbi:methyl-accepting chemotaxis protein [Jannaschia sp. LMIT008]|uniref:methyl-accepting chemotaxis protein n=1 Tax=Jannaschia maritima TaxID=3032585 RepID=UPI0028127E20|nr:methyl-accepting chemotaxis protein [Jannaschia sp. LMIT008]